MSHRRAKILRKTLRIYDIAAGQTDYHMPGGMNKRVIQSGIGKDGAPILREFIYTGTVRLVPECGRRYYKAVKRVGAPA